jgi:hypothetical protein
MTSDAKRLINVFVEHLSDNDKKEVIEFLKDYDSSSTIQKSITETKLYSDKRTLGPVSSYGCPYCGK